MKTRDKGIGLTLALLIAIAAVLGVLWAESRRLPQQIVTLPNGQQFRFAGVTYGTNHVQGTMAARLMSRLPPLLANFVKQTLRVRLDPVTQFNTPEPSLCVWFEKLGTNAPPLWSPDNFFMLADQNDVMAGSRDYEGASFMAGIQWPHAVFQAVPRRSRVLQLRLFEYPWNGPCHEVGCVRFPNPLFGRFPQWQPEPLPAVKKAGVVEVRLLEFRTGTSVSGARNRANSYRHAMKGEEPEAIFRLEYNYLRETKEVWTLKSAELRDPTGNRIRAISVEDAGIREYYSWPSLWPDETAWRLKLELKRKSGFSPSEFVTFKNVPVPKVGARNTFPMTNVVGGVQVVLKDFVRKPDITNFTQHIVETTQIRVELPAHPAGVALDFVRMTTNTGEKPEIFGEGGGEFDRVVSLRSIPANVETVDITWVLQKTRSVEFLVKPPKAE